MLTSSNQLDIHKDLEKSVKKHLDTTFNKPISEHNLEEFSKIQNTLGDKKVVLDSGCGTGLSTEYLAKTYEDCHILGLDKSEVRLNKASFEQSNLSFHRIDLIDFFILADKNNFKAKTNYLLYPNPWPKSKHLLRRWHAHPVFPLILNISEKIVLRSDWKIYIDEFVLALKLSGFNNIEYNKLDLSHGITRFEQKYIEQGRSLYELKVNLN